jgi:hypothetical protein
MYMVYCTLCSAHVQLAVFIIKTLYYLATGTWRIKEAEIKGKIVKLDGESGVTTE